jgi:hypothetical protein
MRAGVLITAVLAGLLVLPTAAASKRTSHTVKLSGNYTSTPKSPTTFTDKGTLSGNPFGKTKLQLNLTLKPGGSASATFKLTMKNGTVSGTVAGSYRMQGAAVKITGKAKFTKGTGQYKGIKAANLSFSQQDTIPPSGGPISFKGKATF